MKTCKNCGYELKNNWKYCPKCGKERDYYLFILLINIFFIIYDIVYFIFYAKYGAMILLTLFINFNLVYFSCKKANYTNNEILYLLVYESIGIIFGAILYTYLSNVIRDRSFNVKAGLSSYGALIGAILMIILFEIKFKKNKWELLKICMLPIPLMYAVGKIGCALAGCCYGINYSGLFHITYSNSLDAPNGVNLFPVQIVETIAFLLIFCSMILIKNVSDKNKCGYIFIICGIAKFILDYFRANRFEFLSINQKCSIVFVIIGILIILFRNRKEDMQVSKKAE